MAHALGVVLASQSCPLHSLRAIGYQAHTSRKWAASPWGSSARWRAWTAYARHDSRTYHTHKLDCLLDCLSPRTASAGWGFCGAGKDEGRAAHGEAVAPGGARFGWIWLLTRYRGRRPCSTPTKPFTLQP